MTMSRRSAPVPLAKPVLLQPGRASVSPVMTETCEQSGCPRRQPLSPSGDALMSPGETLLQVDTGLQLPPPRLPRGHAFARRTQPMPKRGVGSAGGGASPDQSACPFPRGVPCLGSSPRTWSNTLPRSVTLRADLTKPKSHILMNEFFTLVFPEEMPHLHLSP